MHYFGTSWLYFLEWYFELFRELDSEAYDTKISIGFGMPPPIAVCPGWRTYPLFAFVAWALEIAPLMLRLLEVFTWTPGCAGLANDVCDTLAPAFAPVLDNWFNFFLLLRSLLFFALFLSSLSWTSTPTANFRTHPISSYLRSRPPLLPSAMVPSLLKMSILCSRIPYLKISSSRSLNWLYTAAVLLKCIFLCFLVLPALSRCYVVLLSNIYVLLPVIAHVGFINPSWRVRFKLSPITPYLLRNLLFWLSLSSSKWFVWLMSMNG